MALETYHCDHLALPSTSMKALPQRPGPNGSRVTKRKSIPRLGDGLTEILSTIRTRPSTPPKDLSHKLGDSSTSPSSSGVSDRVSNPNPSTLTSTPSTDENWDGQVLSSNPGQDKPSSQPSPVAAPETSNMVVSIGQDTQVPQLAFGLLSATNPDPYDRCQEFVTSQYATELTGQLEQNASLCSISTLAPGQAVQCISDERLSPFHTTTTNAFGEGHGDMYAIQRNLVPGVINKPAHSSAPPKLSHPDSYAATIQLSATELMRASYNAKLSQYVNLGSGSNVHVFVDMSNIFISFCDAVKMARNMPLSSRMKAPHFYFKVLAGILERGRCVEKRILAGSTSSVSDNGHHSEWPRYFFEAEKLGYTMNIFSRVQKRKPIKPNRRARRPSPTKPYQSDFAVTSSDDLEDDTAFGYEVATGEQGVDENLHLNMMDSLCDYESNPGTMVLATGDAASAEFSGGFLKYVTRALDKGWKVELVAWKQSLSWAWTNPEFFMKYREQFNIIFLDDFLNELQSNFLL
ncbi:hypothetical protein F4819DRAFT_211604 [Hypoxylon fuscum]|nr:hypothetical protein F4819DRAFT_211604 [Hypoxylon fuscum]